MNKSSRDYAVYKILLESNISRHHRDMMMMNETLKDTVSNVFGKIKSLFKGNPKELGPGTTILAKNPEFANAISDLKKPISDAINQITAIAKKMNIPNPKSVAATIITQILNDEGIPDNELANPTPIQKPGTSGRGATSASSVPSGTVLQSNSKEAVQSLVQTAAVLQNKKPDEISAKIDSVSSAASLLGNVISHISGVPEKESALVISTLMDLGKLKKEGRSVRSGQLLLAGRRISESVHVQERWMKLSGLSLLREADNFSNKQIVDAAKEVGIKSVEDFKKELVQLNKNPKNSPLGKKLGLTNKLRDFSDNKRLLDMFGEAVKSSGQAGAKGKGAEVGQKETTGLPKEGPPKDHPAYPVYDLYIKGPRSYIKNFNPQKERLMSSYEDFDYLSKMFDKFIEEINKINPSPVSDGVITSSAVRKAMEADASMLGKKVGFLYAREGINPTMQGKIKNYLEKWDTLTSSKTASTECYEQASKIYDEQKKRYDAESKKVGPETEQGKEALAKAEDAAEKAKDVKALPSGGGAAATKDEAPTTSGGAAAAASEAVPKDDKAAVAKAKENFSSALVSVYKRLKNKVSIGNIAKVLIALDETGEIEVTN